jgi:hypothetical protein
VLAVEASTYLTVFFALHGPREFRSHFAAAVGHALEDLGIPPEIICAERDYVAVATLALLEESEAAETLDDLEFFAEIELSYHDDSRTVQQNLNQIPHPDRNPCVPAEAIRQRCGSARPH